MQNALAGAERVFAILDDPALKTERGGTLPLDEPFRELTFRDASLHYGDESTPALRGVSLTVKAGERIAFVGPSGAGKTTLVNLIPRFYDPQRGEILLNGKPLKEYSLASLRRSVSMVSQDAFLFDMTIAENIAYGRDLSSEPDMDRVRSAAGGRLCRRLHPRAARGVRNAHRRARRASFRRPETAPDHCPRPAQGCASAHSGRGHQRP